MPRLIHLNVITLELSIVNYAEDQEAMYILLHTLNLVAGPLHNRENTSEWIEQGKPIFVWDKVFMYMHNDDEPIKVGLMINAINDDQCHIRTISSPMDVDEPASPDSPNMEVDEPISLPNTPDRPHYSPTSPSYVTSPEVFSYMD